MKEYDIFLKQRLTEGLIIVYSLPFRDGVSAVNRVVLRAMLSYFSLQKKIAVANQSALLSEIDEMLRCCNRMAVLRDKVKVAELSGEEISEAAIMNLIAGGAQNEQPA